MLVTLCAHGNGPASLETHRRTLKRARSLLIRLVRPDARARGPRMRAANATSRHRSGIVAARWNGAEVIGVPNGIRTRVAVEKGS